MRREYHRLLNEIHARVLRGEISLDAARAERWGRLCGWAGTSVSPEVATEIAEACRLSYRDHQRCVAGAVELLNRLKPNVVIGVVTNNMTEEQWEKLRILELETRIDFMVTSEEMSIPKPDRRIFEEALRRAECAKTEAVMVGDSWASDVRGAVGAGIRPIWLNRLSVPCPEPALNVKEIRGLEPISDALEAIFGPQK
jgi:putative hydrolase of the HAD superfamily